MSIRKQNRPAASPPAQGEPSPAEPVIARRKWAKRPQPVDQGQLFVASKAGASKPEASSQDASSQSPEATPSKLDDDVAGPRSGSTAACREHPPAAAAGGPLFQYYGHCCDENHSPPSPPTSPPPTPAPEGRPDDFPVQEDRIYSPEDVGQVIGQAYRVRPCNCRKWFCPWCGSVLGVKLRQRLLTRLESFKAIYGVTLTVDGSHFDSPEQAWQYVMRERLLSRLVRELHSRGHLTTKAYFWVVEFQKDTEQPHWHLLLDASFVPYGELVEIWSRFRPASSAPLAERITGENYKGQAPAFGSVRYTQSTDRVKAGYYATKYLTKYPRQGYPEWVRLRIGRMPRFGHSHRFFPRVSGHDPMCFCPECVGDAEPPAKRRPSPKPANAPHGPPRETKSIQERLEACGQSCTIVQVNLVRLADGTEIDGRGKYEGKLDIPFDKACDFFDLDPAEHWQIELNGQSVTALEEYSKQRAAERKAA